MPQNQIDHDVEYVAQELTMAHGLSDGLGNGTGGPSLQFDPSSRQSRSNSVFFSPQSEDSMMIDAPRVFTVFTIFG